MEDGSGHRRPCLGVIGLGSVGTALYQTLSYYHDTVGYDIRGEGPWERLLDTDAVFVCVQTPGGSDGRLDCSHVQDVLRRLESSRYRGLVVVRSTVRVGFMDQAARYFRTLRLVYMPEFLRERSRLAWSVCPDRLVFGGNAADVEQAASYFEWAEEAPRLRMTFIDAEVGKLAHNAFIATKVSFTNEIERICGELGANASDVMQVVSTDRRVRCSEHLRPNLGPYAGSCVPKDTRELLTGSGGSPLLQAVEEVNNRLTGRTEPPHPPCGRVASGTVETGEATP
jgi:UDPglucose 6-dehydrogenase